MNRNINAAINEYMIHLEYGTVFLNVTYILSVNNKIIKVCENKYKPAPTIPIITVVVLSFIMKNKTDAIKWNITTNINVMIRIILIQINKLPIFVV
eukprot:183509_1